MHDNNKVVHMYYLRQKVEATIIFELIKEEFKF